MFFRFLSIIFILGIFAFCVSSRGNDTKPAPLDENDKLIADKYQIDKTALSLLKTKPLYQFTENDMDVYLKYLCAKETDLIKRIIHLAKKNIGQPFLNHSLGEYPFEIYEPSPLYSLEKSDSLSFIQQTYALALGYDWASFFAFLQRIRYEQGEISVASRHHDVALQWIPSLSKWFFYDITDDIGGNKIKTIKKRFDQKDFFKKWNIAQHKKTKSADITYIPYNIVPEISDQLKPGDFLNAIYQESPNGKTRAMGIVNVNDDNRIFLIFCDQNGVREESLLDFFKRVETPEKIVGYQFFRPFSDPLAKIMALDAPHAPIVSGPKGLTGSRFQYPGWIIPPAILTENDREIAKNRKLDVEYLASLISRPLYEFDAREIDDYLGYLKEKQPDLASRLVHLARKNIGEPYQIFLLGEFPFELYDNAPMFSLHKSDCVVFSEHMYAMALSGSWEEFFVFLQRLRFKNGEISVLTRNHFTIAEWDTSNSWLLSDISKTLAGDHAAPMIARTRHNSFFKNRYGIEVDMNDAALDTFYVPSERVSEIAGQLQNGDFVNVIYGKGKECYAGHVGLITRGEKGEVYFLHSTPPRVREQLLVDYNKSNLSKNTKRKKDGKALFLGFKFLRLRNNPLENLKKLDGPDAPVVKAPLGVLKGPGRRFTPVK